MPIAKLPISCHVCNCKALLLLCLLCKTWMQDSKAKHNVSFSFLASAKDCVFPFPRYSWLWRSRSCSYRGTKLIPDYLVPRFSPQYSHMILPFLLLCKTLISVFCSYCLLVICVKAIELVVVCLVCVRLVEAKVQTKNSRKKCVGSKKKWKTAYWLRF